MNSLAVKPTVDLNCDLGEGEPLTVTEALMRSITSCNVACGGHYGDANSMRAAAELAKRHGVAVGAHPSFADRTNFGRRSLPVDEDTLHKLLDGQVAALDNVLRDLGMPLHHIKLHGALYNLAERNEKLACAYAGWAKKRFPGVPLVALANGCVARAARENGVPCAREFFADRAYNDDGSLAAREIQGAVIEDAETICQRTVKVITERQVTTVSGKAIRIEAETICVHGDNPRAIEIVARLRRALEEAGLEVRAF